MHPISYKLLTHILPISYQYIIISYPHFVHLTFQQKPFQSQSSAELSLLHDKLGTQIAKHHEPFNIPQDPNAGIWVKEITDRIFEHVHQGISSRGNLNLEVFTDLPLFFLFSLNFDNYNENVSEFKKIYLCHFRTNGNKSVFKVLSSHPIVQVIRIPKRYHTCWYALWDMN